MQEHIDIFNKTILDLKEVENIKIVMKIRLFSY